MRFPVVLAVLFGLFSVSTNHLHADFTTPGINDDSRGSVLSSGASGGLDNYFAGNSSGNNNLASRDFFNFKLDPSYVVGPITGAYLLLQNPYPATSLGTTFGKMDFFGLGSTIPTFGDIGAGTKYTNSPVTEDNQTGVYPNSYVRVDLNAAALAAITTAVKNSSMFSLGGVSDQETKTTSTDTPGFFAFTTTYPPAARWTTQLFITSVPEPSSWIIASLGLVCLSSVRRKKAKK